MATPLALTINEARQQPDGVEVSLNGTVTVSGGQFRSASFDQGFAIQDQGGGIYVSTDRTTDLHIGDVVEVVGILQDDGHDQQVVQLEHWRQQPSLFSELEPYPASIQEATTQLEGQLVAVQGTIVRPLTDDAPYGDRLWIEDDTGSVQIYIPRSTEIAPQTLPFLQLGQAIQVIGLSSQYDSKDEVMPRMLADMRRLE